jgi:hypothetical protein
MDNRRGDSAAAFPQPFAMFWKELVMARALHVGVWLLVVGCLLGPLATRVEAKKMPAPLRFHFEIDPKTPLKELLPAPPEAMALPLPWQVQELAQVPELFFQKPAPPVKKPSPLPSSASAEERRQSLMQDIDREHEAMKETAHLIARINHLNEKGTDQFLKILRQERPDLAGLPFVMGDACRQSKDQQAAFAMEVASVQGARSSIDEAFTSEEPEPFWTRYKADRLLRNKQAGDAGTAQFSTARAISMRVAALTQILAPDREDVQQGLVLYLSDIKQADATRALARLAIFSFDAQVRWPALSALKKRDQSEYVDVLLAGLRHPWPAVAKQAAEAIIKLDCKDLVPKLVPLLDEPDPRAPAEIVVDGKKTLAVRELVRVNHHRSCLLCHAPGNTPDLVTKAGFVHADVVVGPVPSPGVRMVPPARGYGSFASPDILVRVDVTYLRQDFSLLLPVKDAAPWPEMQRFDYLVRTRIVTAEEAATYRQWLQKQGPGYLPHQQATLTALRALTGRDAEPTVSAWRAVLGE